jgi:hypothetical protein
VLLEREEESSPVLISQDSRYFIVKHEYYLGDESSYLYWVCHNRNGDVVWQLNGTVRQMGRSAIVCTLDLGLVVVSDGKMVRAYTPPRKQDP